MNDTLPTPMDVRLMTAATHVLLGVFVLMGLGSLGWWAARHPVWTVSAISVHGDVVHQNTVTLRTYLASRLSGSFLTIDLRAVQRLFESVPWVRSAVVQREFPNRLKVTLTEHRAVAWWGRAGEGRLINDDGQVFEANPDDRDADEWVELNGPHDQADAVLALYRQVHPLIDPLGQPLRRLELSARGSWHMELENGARLELGRGLDHEIVARVAQFALTLPQLTARYGRELESADLRYPNGYALRMRGVSTQPADTDKTTTNTR